MILSDVFSRRYRGFRVVDLAALAVLLVVALASYARPVSRVRSPRKIGESACFTLR